MIGKKTNFVDSPYFVGEPGNFHLKPNAPKKVIKEFNEFMEDSSPEPPNGVPKLPTVNLDFRVFYDIERYLFLTVNSRFKRNGFLDAPDFFLIVIWKSNRSKTKIAKRLLNMGYPSLQEAVRSITAKVSTLNNSKLKLKYLMADCGFRLPMASAILTVLYPESFTIYDVRVCDILREHGYKYHSLTSRKFTDKLWNDYIEYINAVSNSAPSEYSLRDKDRYLWSKSFYEQLIEDINKDFNVDKEVER